MPQVLPPLAASPASDDRCCLSRRCHRLGGRAHTVAARRSASRSRLRLAAFGRTQPARRAGRHGRHPARPQQGCLGRAAARRRRVGWNPGTRPGRPTRRSVQRLRRDPPASDRAGDAMSAGDPWRPFVDALSGFMNGAEIDQLSVADFLAYDDAASGTNWRLPEGLRRLHRRSRRRPACCPWNPRYRDLGRATASGSTPTADQSRRGRRSSPSRPRCWQAARSASTRRPTSISTPHRACRSASPTRSFSRSPSRTRCRRRATCSAASTSARTGSYYLRPFGRPVVECFLGGVLARELEAAGEDRRRRLRHRRASRALLGADFARGLAPLAVTAWGREPTILGSYSHALPGSADARAVLARPVSPRLCFAGEACSPRDFSTAHGAWQSRHRGGGPDRGRPLSGSRPGVTFAAAISQSLSVRPTP